MSPSDLVLSTLRTSDSRRGTLQNLQRQARDRWWETAAEPGLRGEIVSARAVQWAGMASVVDGVSPLVLHIPRCPVAGALKRA